VATSAATRSSTAHPWESCSQKFQSQFSGPAVLDPPEFGFSIQRIDDQHEIAIVRTLDVGFAGLCQSQNMGVKGADNRVSHEGSGSLQLSRIAQAQNKTAGPARDVSDLQHLEKETIIDEQAADFLVLGSSQPYRAM
jgi:hypothetical protein